MDPIVIWSPKGVDIAIASHMIGSVIIYFGHHLVKLKCLAWQIQILQKHWYTHITLGTYDHASNSIESTSIVSFRIFSSIALDPKQGILYYSTWASDQSKGQIMLAWMDGSHRSVFVDDCTNKTACTEIKWPSSLTIDHIDRKLYWCDSRNERIERIDLDGSHREVVIQRSTNGNFYPFSMAYHNDFIFFTDTLSGNIIKVSLQDAAKRE